MSKSSIKSWIEAMRLRTLPVSVAGVIAATAFSVFFNCFKAAPALLCLLFAVLAQISSNFANEYYDFKNGLDHPGREGPRRGVTEGDISPTAMRNATFGVLALACAVGCSLIYWGGWWLLIAGIVIALGVVAYSAGPYPLSHHALGEVAVIFFFGIIPVNLTFYLQAGHFDSVVLEWSIGIGLMGANILVVNNYRDCVDDAMVGKITVAVKFGPRFASSWYLVNGFLAIVFMSGLWACMWYSGMWAWLIVPTVYLLTHTALWWAITHNEGRRLNPFLGITAMLMLLYSLGMLAACIALNH